MDSPCVICEGPSKSCEHAGTRARCLVPGQCHLIRNCADNACQENGRCVNKDAKHLQIGLLKPAGTIELKDTLGARPMARIEGPLTPTPFTTTKRVVEDFKGAVDGGGYKASMDDPRKVPVWLVPVALIMGVARVLGYGAKKYAAHNWRRGMAYSEVYSAIQRHLTSWLEGEDNDPDTGMSHLWHAGCGLAFLCEYIAFPKLYGKFDDRFKRPEA